MPTTFHEAGPDVYQTLRATMKSHFPQLTVLDPELRIMVLMASGNAWPCLKKFKSPVTHDVKVTTGEERASGGGVPDVRFLIDRMSWDSWKEDERVITLAQCLIQLDIETHAHESASLLCCDKDEYERPIVKLKPADYLTCGWLRCYEWFGRRSWEYRQLVRIGQDFGQEVFDWMKADATGDDADQSAVAARIEDIEREEGEGPVPSSVSFSGADLDEIAKAGKVMRKKAGMSAKT